MILQPLLGLEVPGSWKAELHREFNMTDDANLFHKERRAGMLPLYEGKMIHQFDAFYSQPRYFIEEKEGRQALGSERLSETLDYERYRLACRDIARNTDERTMITAILPRQVYAGHTLHLCGNLQPRELLYLSTIFNSFTFDWMLRYKVAAHCSIFYIYQMPAPRLQDGAPAFDQLVERAAKLTCTHPEFSDLAREAGITLDDAARDPAERARVRAEIDAIVAHLYGITAEELEHILAAFPLVDAGTKAQVLDTFRNWKPPSDDPLLKLIAAGESLRVEFKSTARWDIKQNRVSKEMEQVIVKTVAAFMNSEGGMLLIGVADDGTILGLRDDYKTLGSRQNADAFENWLTTRLLESMGRDRTRHFRINFATIEGKQVCRVDVSRSSRPVFVNDVQNVERLYVRAGNSTRELTVSEALQYCREHFVNGSKPTNEPPSEVSPIEGPSRQTDLIQPGPIETIAPPHVAAANAPEEAPRRRRNDQYEIEDVIAIIRDVVSGSEPMEREEVIRQIGRQVGAERVGSRIRDLIESGLNAASRRSITYTDNRGLRAFCRTIDDYKRDDLKNVLRSVVGRTWTDEDEAIRLGARYLGFRRTGSRIDQAFRSAIRGGLRQGTLERNGNLIRAA